MKAGDRVPCAVCAGPALVLDAEHPGYRTGERYAIAECCYCDAQFAEPRRVEDGVYEAIYASARTLPGYARYAWFASRILDVSRPLHWLARQEDMYAFVRAALASVDTPGRTRVVEVGSGLGYLTYALARAGFDVRGWDVSARAVAEARARFGDHYECVDITAVPPAAAATFDLVVMTEVLEHVPDPEPVLAGIARLLRPGGRALLTTPNKSACPQGAVWMTDNPPIHLWWFSETTLRRLAERVGLRIDFYDFASGAPFAPPRVAIGRSLPPYLSADGRQEFPRPGVRRAMRWWPGGVVAVASVLRRARYLRHQALLVRQRAPVLGVILQAPGARGT